MIKILLGSVGSGKTACMVREMYLNNSHRLTYTNIKTKKIKNCKLISPDMIINNEIVDYKKKKDGSSEPVYKKTLNAQYWKNINEPINVVIDEAHSIINARRAMSKTNEIVNQWLALIRRVLGSSESGYGELTFITQLWNRLDIIAREMATQVRYHICHFQKTCKKCRASWSEHSEQPENLYQCPLCASFSIRKHNHQIEVYHFKNMEYFLAWKEYKQQSYYKHYVITDIEKYFPLYNTLQWDNLFEDYY